MVNSLGAEQSTFAAGEQEKSKHRPAPLERTLPLLQGGSQAGHGLPNPNSEDRNPKSRKAGRKPKPESERLVARMFVIRISGFGLLSDFRSRPSGFCAV